MTHQVHVYMGEPACRDWSGAVGCLWTFPRWYCWQSLHMAAMSLHTPFYTKRAVTMCLVAHMPGRAMLWMVWKTAALSASGTRGLVIPHATSHNRLAPSTWTALTAREYLVACSALGQLVWFAANLEKELPAASCMSATPGSEGGKEFSRVAT